MPRYVYFVHSYYMPAAACPLCHEIITKVSRDHVFAEALGSFDNALICRSICGACNKKYGDLEDHLFKESFFTPFRDIMGIRSKKRKGKEFVDYVKRLRDRKLSELADIVFLKDGAELRPQLTGDLPLRLNPPPVAEINYIDGESETVDLGGKSPQQAAEIIYGKMETRKGSVWIRTMVQDYIADVVDLLKKGGMKSDDLITLEPTPKIITAQGKISGELNYTHIKGAAYILLKGLLYRGFEAPMLAGLTNFIVRDDCGFVQFTVKAAITGSAIPNIKQGDYHHSLQWHAGMDYLDGVVSLFKSPATAINIIFKVIYPKPRLVIGEGLVPGKGCLQARYKPRDPKERAGRGSCHEF